jgi:hypothetical protein
VRTEEGNGSADVADRFGIGRPIGGRPVLDAGDDETGLGDEAAQGGGVRLVREHEPAAGDVDHEREPIIGGRAQQVEPELPLAAIRDSDGAVADVVVPAQRDGAEADLILGPGVEDGRCRIWRPA